MNASSVAVFLPLLIVPLMLLSLAWHVAVIVFLYKIWQKVKLLSG